MSQRIFEVAATLLRWRCRIVENYDQVPRQCDIAERLKIGRLLSFSRDIHKIRSVREGVSKHGRAGEGRGLISLRTSTSSNFETCRNACPCTSVKAENDETPSKINSFQQNLDRKCILTLQINLYKKI